MVASVQELIAAGNARYQRPKSAIGELLDSAVGGYDEGVKQQNTMSDTRLNIARALLERQQAAAAQQAAVHKAQRNAQWAVDHQTENAINQSADAALAPAGTRKDNTPAGKLKHKETMDGNGDITDTYETADAPTPTSLDALTAEKVRNGEITLEQAYAMKRKGEGGGADKPPAGYRFKGDGSLEAIPGGPGVKAPTEAQTNAGLFGTRAKEAQAQLDELFKGGFDPTSATTGIRNAIPDELGGNFVRTPQMQEFNQAGLNFLSAILRKESGAAISTGEYTMGRKQYLPQPGDDAATLEFKRKNRETAISQILAGAKQDGQGSGLDAMISAQGGGASPAPAPHGQRVKQGGKVYEWNGSSYEEAR